MPLVIRPLIEGLSLGFEVPGRRAFGQGGQGAQCRVRVPRQRRCWVSTGIGREAQGCLSGAS